MAAPRPGESCASEQVSLGRLACLFSEKSLIGREIRGAGSGIGEGVAALVFEVAGVPLDPFP